MPWAKRVALILETGIWYGVALGIAALLSPVALIALVLWIAGLAASVIAFERRGGFGAAVRDRRWRLLAWHVSVGRAFAAILQSIGLWSALHIAPALVVGALAGGAVLASVSLSRSRAGHPVFGLTRAATFTLAATCAVNAAAYAGWFGLDCAAVEAQPGVTPLLRLAPVASHPAPDPLLDESCLLVRSITIDPEDGRLLVACGPERVHDERNAVIRLDPGHPAERQTVRGISASMALTIPGKNLVAISFLGGDQVRLVDREKLEPRGDVRIGGPLAMTWDEHAERLLVGYEGEGASSCVTAVDPSAATRLDGVIPGFEPTAEELRRVYPPADPKSLACRTGGCTPWRIVPLPELGLVMVGNALGTCTWHTVSYSGLEYVVGHEWMFPARDVERSPSGAEIGIAMSFPGKIAIVDARNLLVDREIHAGVGTMWFDWLSERELVVGDYVTGELRRIDARDGTRHGRAGLGGKLRQILFDRTRGRLYAASQCGVFSLDPDAAFRDR